MTCKRVTVGFVIGIVTGIGACSTARTGGKSAVKPPWVVDDEVTINSRAEALERRRSLIRFIWGSAGFPARSQPALVQKNVPSPVTGAGDLARVDNLVIKMEAGESTVAHHFVPRSSNGRLVILHHGHGCTFDDDGAKSDYGMARAVKGLLGEGYSVLAMYMPHMMPGDCGTLTHEQTFGLPVATGSPMKFFLEPVAVSLNYLRSQSAKDGFPRYRDTSMVGLSGGGWTTVLYAAIDPTIDVSIDVAGSMPLFLRSKGSLGDIEQYVGAFYAIAGYPDLYLLGAHGEARKQIQILNRRDDCCFGRSQHGGEHLGGVGWDEVVRGYEGMVQRALRTTAAGGSYRVQIDEAATKHEISRHALKDYILIELQKTVASSS